MSETSFQVRLDPAGGCFSCAPNQTVLDAAMAAGYWLPHQCRSGTCGACRLPVVSGAVSHAAASPEATAVAETAPGQCLACQARPTSDLVLDAPTVPAEPGQRIIQAGARVTDVQRPSADVTVVRLQVPSTSGWSFRPGQYADVVLRDGTRRSYSMANAPDADGTIEWHVRRMEGGRFSPHAYDKLKARDLLRIEGPFGSFALRSGTAPVVLLASGTGYAPIASMLKVHAKELADRGAVLYWGGRRLQDLYAVPSVAQWEAEHPGIRLVPVLSDPGAVADVAVNADAGAPASAATGVGAVGSTRLGLVHEAVLADLPDLTRHEVYACGNPLMIEAARRDFTERGGLDPANFLSDAFVIRPAQGG